jgi:hypothetical protein
MMEVNVIKTDSSGGFMHHVISGVASFLKKFLYYCFILAFVVFDAFLVLGVVLMLLDAFHTDHSTTQISPKVELHTSTKRANDAKGSVKERLLRIGRQREETARTLEEIVFSIDKELEEKPVSGLPGRRNQRIQERESEGVLHGEPVKSANNAIIRAFKGAKVTFR